MRKFCSGENLEVTCNGKDGCQDSTVHSFKKFLVERNVIYPNQTIYRAVPVLVEMKIIVNLRIKRNVKEKVNVDVNVHMKAMKGKDEAKVT